MSFTQKTILWMTLAIPFILVVLAATTLAAPPGSPSTEDLLGSRVYYRNRAPLANTEDNTIPVTFDMGQPQTLYDPQALGVQQQPSENALLSFLLARRFMLGGSGSNRLRSYVDSSSNEISRKRSYSKYCAFNAVSCFGK